MPGTMEELLRKAFEDRGQSLPAARKAEMKATSTAKDKSSENKRHKDNPNSSHKPTKLAKKLFKKHHYSKKRSNVGNEYDASVYVSPKKSIEPVKLKELKIKLGKDAQVWAPDNSSDNRKPLSDYVKYGQATQCYLPGTFNDEREVVIGLDFGTSNVKVVVGDPGLGRAFAVPFFEGIGVDSYLLPARLYESGGTFKLFGREPDYRDLKLSLIAHPTERPYQIPVIGFIGLVLRHIRGWLLKVHKEIYGSCRIVWSLSVGLPAEYHLEDSLYKTFKYIANIAWIVSTNEDNLSQKSIDAFCQKYEELPHEDISQGLLDDCEVKVIPEIAAQIHGFVNSSKFNKNAKNFYLMVDVGAGTVDSSLFHVKPERGGKWSFEFYTSVVAPNGVMNLHRERINWWIKYLKSLDHTEDLVKDLISIQFPTDWFVPLPLNYDEYLLGVKLENVDELNPDIEFFKTRLCKQVMGQTYADARKKNLILEGDLKHIPAFYCGGGMQLPFYKKLKEKMKSHPSISWMKTEPRTVELPKDMEAPGLNRHDYHRLSVAYGLSFVNVKNVTQVKPIVEPIEKRSHSWRDNYIDRDLC